MKKKTAWVIVSTSQIILFSIILLSFSACNREEVSDRFVFDHQYKKAIIEGQKNLREFNITSFIPGFSVAVSIDGKLVWSEGSGLASKELKAPVTRHTKFRIGTSTQMYTAYLIALLQQEGKLNVDSSFYSYMPNFPKKEFDFTPRMLGVFSAGFQEDRIEQVAKISDIKSLKDYVNHFSTNKLGYTPDAYFAQSDYSAALLGALAEQITKEAYVKLIREKILDTLKLDHTTFDYKSIIIENRSQFYANDYVARLIDAPDVNLMPFAPAHGILSTAEDLNKAAQLILKPGFFTSESIKLFTQKHQLTNGQQISRAFGWWIGQDKNDRKIIAQIGNTIGGSSYIVVYPEQKLVVSICANKGGNMEELPANAIAQIFLKYIDSGKQN